VDFTTNASLAPASGQVGPKLNGFVFQNFTMARDGKAAGARVTGNNTADQV
jgi:hypothetical protein